MARIQSQPQELLYATGAAIKLKKKKESQGMGGVRERWMVSVQGIFQEYTLMDRRGRKDRWCERMTSAMNGL